MSTSTTIHRNAVFAWLDFWPRFLLFPALAIVLYVPFVAGWGGEHWLVQTVWVVGLTYCWFCVGGSFHEAAHQTLFRSPTLNAWVGRLLGLMIGIPYTAYRETHRRHHAYLNTPDDYELWPYCDHDRSLAFRRAFVWLDLIGGIVTAPYIYGRIFFSRDPHLSDKVRRTILVEYVTMALIWCTAVAGLLYLASHNQYDWRDFNVVWLLPLILSPVVNTARKFVEHLGMTSTDPMQGTRTIAGGGFVTRLLSYFNFDIAIHGPHHRYPKAHHYELAPKLDQYQKSAPEQSLPVFPSYMAAMVDVLPDLWNNPATGVPGKRSRWAKEQPENSNDQAIEWEAESTAAETD
jgi:fatty acid desaturase